MTAERPYGRLEGTWAEFRDDVRTAVSVWKAVPWLVVIGVLIHGPPAIYTPTADPTARPSGELLIPGGAWVPMAAVFVVLLVVALLVFSAGWSGAERLTYAWVWSGSEVRFGTAVSAVWGFVGRFIVLALLLLIPALIVSAVISAAAGPLIGTALSSLLIGILLTFVTPALAYDEERATRGLGIGFRMLGSQGSRAVWYAFVGPAVLSALLVLGQAGSVMGVLGWLLVGVAATALRGATAAAYLRLTRPAGIAGPPPAGP